MKEESRLVSHCFFAWSTKGSCPSRWRRASWPPCPCAPSREAGLPSGLSTCSSLHGSWRPWPAYPFVCALLNAYFLAALPVDRERMAASGRMETATIVAGAFGLLCAACLTDSSRMETVSTAGRTFVGAGMLACLFWYATARFRSKSAASPGSEAMAALSALIVSSTTFGLVCTVGTGLVWKNLVLMYPLNLLLVLAKLAKGSKDAEAGLSNMRRRFRR